MRNNGLSMLMMLLLNTTTQADMLPPSYTPYDQHKAVITCMQYIYLEKHTQTPATEDAFGLCEQRFLALSRTLSHEDFVQARTSTQENNIYYQMLFGIPSESMEIPKAPE